jgi:hypothetical protein
MVQFGSTKAEVLAAINKALTGEGNTTTSSGFIEYNFQYADVWDLEPGIYKWTYKGQKYIRYTKVNQRNVSVGDINTDELFLEVVKGRYPLLNKPTDPNQPVQPDDGTTTVYNTYKAFKVESGRYASQVRDICWGWVSSDNGEIYKKEYQYIPDYHVKPATSELAKYSLSYNYTESLIGNLNVTDFLRPIEYGFTINADTIGAPTGLTEDVRATLKTITPYYMNNVTFAPIITQELYVNGEKYIRNVTASSSGYIYGVFEKELSGSSSTGFTELTTSSVRIWDLDAGIYKWTYAGQKRLYYKGSFNSATQSIGDDKNIDVYLEVTTGASTSFDYKYFKIETGLTTLGERTVYFGYSSATDGVISSRKLSNIPTAPAVTTTENQTISGNKTFTGAVDFSNANVSGLSNGIPVLTTQTVNLADLEVCIYKWEYSVYNAEEDYDDTSKILLVGNSTCTLYSNPVFLQVHKDGNEVSFEAIDNEGYGYDETHRVIYYGGMHLEDGDGYWNRRALNNIPDEYIDTTQFSEYIKKTKITAAELKSYVGDYSNHFGKIVQLVYKGTSSNNSHGLATQILGIFTIDSNSINIHKGYSEASESELSGYKCSLHINSTNAYIEYYIWSFDFATTSLGNTVKVNITDSNFDIYTIG